jgi:TonB-linked SusC/RagA family outer membrane protein
MNKKNHVKKVNLGIFIILMSLFSISVMAQQQKITGKVSNETGETLIGVSVFVKGTTTGSITDVNGNFTLQLPSNAKTLIFSYIGFKTQQVEIGNQIQFNVVLQESAQMLDEVVAIGYGVQRKSDLTGASNRLTEKDMNKSVATSPIEMMQGRVSGVNITQNNGEPGGGMTVQIRGSNSIRSGQGPLYVIDGIPLDNTDLTPTGGSAAGYGSGGSLNPLGFISPEDIESIDILKDASSTAIYGARGANGVVIITTKKGKSGKAVITYDGYTGISQIRQKMDLLSPAQFRNYVTTNGLTKYDFGASNDWQNLIFRDAFTQSHNISYSGGNDKSTYHSSLSYLDEQGIVKTTGVQKLNASINLTQKAFNNKLNLTEKLVVAHQQDNRAPISEQSGSGYEGDLVLTALKLNPTYPIYNPDGSYYQHATDQRNPVAMLNLVNDITQTDRIIGNVSAEVEILKGLKYKLNLGIDRANAERRVNQENGLTYLANKGEANINNVTATNSLIENYITYVANLNKNNSLNFLLGQSYQNVLVTTHNTDVTGFTVEGVKYTDNLQYGNYSTAIVSSSAQANELQSFYGRANYGFKDKYLLTLTGRYDGSSRFGANKKYGFFPSAAGAWRITEEDFMKDVSVVSNLKLRLGWGVTGNQEIPNKISLISVGTTPDANGYFNGSMSNGITFLRTPNPNIQWESTEQSNLGIDFGFLKNRLSGTIDLFSKQTTNVLLEIASQAPAATQTQWENVPGLVISNAGFELGLTGVIIDKKELNWSVTANFATVKNKVSGLTSGDIFTGIASGQGLSGTNVQVVSNGQPIGTFYGMVYQGLDANGLSKYKEDASGTPVKEYLGTALPAYTYSLSTNLQIKRFDISMFWYGSQGNKIYNNTANALFDKGALNNGFNVTQTVMNSAEAAANSNAFSSRFIQDGSFLRLSNVTLGYTFNTKSISWLEKVRIYATGNNLILFTNYKGFDPEVNVSAANNGVPSMGIDYTTFPKSRTFTFGVNLQF